MHETLSRRLSFVSAILLILVSLIVYRLVSLQFGVDTAYFALIAQSEYRYQVLIRPPRGEIYDRNEVLLATNTVEYEIGMSPVLIYDREGTAGALAEVMGLPYDELLEDMSSPQPYVLLVRPAPAAMGQAVMELNLDGISVTPISRRFYPHGAMASHVLGFVGYDDEGYYGIEGFYNEILKGEVTVGDQSRIPFEATGSESWRSGSDLRLTIVSEIQYLAEDTLARALEETGAQSGTILVLDPRTGEILAMANRPAFDPNRFYSQDTALFTNPAISDPYEPGSTLKVLTMAIALETGVVEPDSTYEDTGVIEIGGIEVYNWDRQAHGVTTMTDLLGKSLNVGAATLALRIGPRRFYAGLEDFGLGEPLGIDLQGEVGGTLRQPGDADWHESDLATNSFGQGLTVTPLQLAVAVGAIANEGLIVQPHMVSQRIAPDGTVTDFEPTVLGRAVSQETARQLSRMLANALEREASAALVPGYTIAGKTGTAEIPIPGGYDPDRTIASFVGFGPVSDPRFVVLIRLDQPTSSRWGSETAAPVFSYFVSRLVVLMEIPPDDPAALASTP
ncbi:MAG TPA: penicillin-binding protein 2 [Chloroflexi bacterium]|nr:penicillin-binding protein 2 [Chloroflexota bacterium]